MGQPPPLGYPSTKGKAAPASDSHVDVDTPPLSPDRASAGEQRTCAQVRSPPWGTLGPPSATEGGRVLCLSVRIATARFARVSRAARTHTQDLSACVPQYSRYVSLPGRLLLLGFGSVAAGALPLVLRHVEVPPECITIITAPDRQAEAEEAVRQYGLGRCLTVTLTLDNYVPVLDPLLAPGDFVLNLSVDVSSVAVMQLCQAKRCLYLDTVVEPWAGGYLDTRLSVQQRSNYAQREAMLALKRGCETAAASGGPPAMTALVTHGANPGLVSHLVKHALLDVAAAKGHTLRGGSEPATRQQWAALAQELGVKTIHIAERDSQQCVVPKHPGEFVNTWSVDGFISEGCQPAELGWGTHERELPHDGRAHSKDGCAIYLTRPGCATRVRSWCPGEGPFHGFLVTHNEAISLADWLTLRDDATGGVVYRPTVHYAYHPCDAAVASLHELAGKNYNAQSVKRILTADDIAGGRDELGVLLCGMPDCPDGGAYWLGSQLSCDDARRLAPCNSATTLQVTASVLAGMVWAVQHPHNGVTEPEDVAEWRSVLDMVAPYVAPLVGAWTEWNPLHGRGQGGLFPEEDLVEDDPWQFSNIRCS